MVPFLRQTVADVTLRGRFGPIWLNPVNLRLTIAKESGATAKKRTDKAASFSLQIRERDCQKLRGF